MTVDKLALAIQHMVAWKRVCGGVGTTCLCCSTPSQTQLFVSTQLTLKCN